MKGKDVRISHTCLSEVHWLITDGIVESTEQILMHNFLKIEIPQLQLAKFCKTLCSGLQSTIPEILGLFHQFLTENAFLELNLKDNRFFGNSICEISNFRFSLF
jgi:hypothetical protein